MLEGLRLSAGDDAGCYANGFGDPAVSTQGGFEGDVAAGGDGLRNGEGMRRFGAIAWGEDIEPTANAHKLVGFERAIDQGVAARGLAAYDALELALGENLVVKSLFNKVFSESLHDRIIPDTSIFRKFLELNRERAGT